MERSEAKIITILQIRKVVSENSNNTKIFPSRGSSFAGGTKFKEFVYRRFLNLGARNIWKII